MKIGISYKDTHDSETKYLKTSQELEMQQKIEEMFKETIPIPPKIKPQQRTVVPEIMITPEER